ncbi:sigma-54-dependent Fis family transcriptional regulator [Prolixibacteraceae bacterium JC049]|nr:sigma-54-dependent Fis family transcriptional regulator [Prolixibacteraceae bacterium JC049]
MIDRLSILVLDDDLFYCKLAKAYLKDDFTVYTALKPSKAFDVLQSVNVDILICDFNLPEMNGLEVVRTVKRDYPDVEIIMISSDAGMETVIESFRLGAVDFFHKPFDFGSVKIAIERTKKFVFLHQQLRQFEMNNRLLTQELNDYNGFEIISVSPVMEQIKQIMYKVAQSDDTSVIITGESGVGKELVARGIHYMSNRKGNYFGAVNMSAIPDSLFESEFFGHKKGAFTGAVADRAGWFEIADDGTLFLDEIGDMQGNLQIKLLRVLEDRKFIKVGSQKEQRFNIRIVAATNKKVDDLKHGVDFRLDLFHRLGTFEIYVPPLRERKEDIPVLLNHFVNKFAAKMRKKIKGIDPVAEKELMDYPFPGNVRELRNLAERAVILSDDDVLHLEHFPDVNNNRKIQMGTPITEIFDLEEVERRTIMQALERSNYNKSKAAKLLNINWNALHRRLQKYELILPEV